MKNRMVISTVVVVTAVIGAATSFVVGWSMAMDAAGEDALAREIALVSVSRKQPELHWANFLAMVRSDEFVDYVGKIDDVKVRGEIMAEVERLLEGEGLGPPPWRRE